MSNKKSSENINESIKQWIRPEIRVLNAYHVPLATDCIKLDAMENPYQWPESMVDEWLGLVKEVELNRYPDPSASALKESLRKSMSVPTSAEILLGNGSDELIQMILMALASKDINGKEQTVLSVDPSFVMYHMVATYAGMNYASVPLKADFCLDVDAFLSAIDKHKPAIIFIAYPNNPTGNLFDEADIEEIIKIAPGFVVLDEAYHPFAQNSFMPKLEHYEQLLVMRTVSKMGLAGLRLGMLAGNPDLIHEIDKVRLPYNINVLTQQAAKAALEHITVLDEQAAMIRSEREVLLTRLSDMQGIDVFPSKANFILFRIIEGDADEVFERIRKQGVLIKNMKATTGPLKQCLRVTVGKAEENNLFMQVLEKALGVDVM